jgi:outer membrane protein assembly factor BamE (lipoprotein component of BamABCDE complex)
MPASPALLVAATALLAVATACSPTVTNHGHRLDPDSLAEIRPGITSREEVYQLLGSPSATGTFDAERWYYISQRNEQMSFYQSEVTAQDVVAVDFDATGVVREVERRDLSAARQVEPSAEVTRTLGNELTIVEQFLGNVGRFNTDPSPTGLNRTVGRSGGP